jgi:hypothetical protein
MVFIKRLFNVSKGEAEDFKKKIKEKKNKNLFVNKLSPFSLLFFI